MGRWLCDQRQAKRGTGGKFKLYPEREALLQKLVDEGKLMWIVKNLYGAFQSKRYIRKEDGEIELLDNDEEYDEDGAKTTSDTEGDSEVDRRNSKNSGNKPQKTLLHLYNYNGEPIVESGIPCTIENPGLNMWKSSSGSKTATYNMVPQGSFVHTIFYSLLNLCLILY